MNEKADKAAREAANTTIPCYNTKLPLDSLFIHLKTQTPLAQRMENHSETTTANDKKWFLQERNTLLAIKT